jgi:hypothetical protein
MLIKVMKTIEINKPNDVFESKVCKQINELANKGVKSKDIILILHFCCSDSLATNLLNEFRKIKNKVYFELEHK